VTAEEWWRIFDRTTQRYDANRHSSDVLDESTEPETRFDAANALLRVVGKRVPRGKDPIFVARDVALKRSR
jgi:hypothetical protein